MLRMPPTIIDDGFPDMAGTKPLRPLPTTISSITYNVELSQRTCLAPHPPLSTYPRTNAKQSRTIPKEARQRLLYADACHAATPKEEIQQKRQRQSRAAGVRGLSGNRRRAVQVQVLRPRPLRSCARDGEGEGGRRRNRG